MAQRPFLPAGKKPDRIKRRKHQCQSTLREKLDFLTIKYKTTEFYKVFNLQLKNFALSNLKSLEKYYAVDLGLHYFLLGNKTGNEGFILENIVYLELVRRGYEIYVGKFGDMEVDFVTIKNGLPEYYQVSLSVTMESDKSMHWTGSAPAHVLPYRGKAGCCSNR